MAIPNYQALMLPVLQSPKGAEVRVGEVVNRLADTLQLSPEDRAELVGSGKQTIFSNRVHWAKTYLAKAGLIEVTKHGHFRVTPRGDDVLATSPASIDNKFLSQFEEFRVFLDKLKVEKTTPSQPGPATDTISEPETPDETMRVAHRQIEATLAQDLLDRIQASSPEFFERLIVSLLLSMGYGGTAADAGRALGKSGDNGIDGVIDQDALGLDRVYIQAKRYAVGNSVGSGAIRDFFGSLDRHKASKGLFVTTSTFSPSARETAEFLSKRLVLVDGAQLTKLMIRHNVGCRVEEALEIRRLDEDFFAP